MQAAPEPPRETARPASFTREPAEAACSTGHTDHSMDASTVAGNRRATSHPPSSDRLQGGR